MRSIGVVLLTLILAPAARAQDLPGVLVSRQLAASRGLATGDEVQFSRDAKGASPRRFRIVGIYEPTPDPGRLNASKFEARLHLPDLLSLIADPDDPLGTEAVEAINIRLHDPEDARRFARDLATRMPGIVARPVASAERVGPFIVLEQFHFAIALVTIGASTMFLLALTVMLVDERRTTVGILRLIGLTPRRILVQVFVEGVLIASGGAAFGLLLAYASEGLINRYFQWHYDTTLVFVRVTPSVAARCVAIAVPLGVAGSVAASWALLRRHVLALAGR